MKSTIYLVVKWEEYEDLPDIEKAFRSRAAAQAHADALNKARVEISTPDVIARRRARQDRRTRNGFPEVEFSTRFEVEELEFDE